MAKIIQFNSDKTAEKLNLMHEIFVESMRTTVATATEMGGILNNVKESLKHGDFIPWVEKNLKFKTRTAQNYMKLSEQQEKLALANPSTMTEALAMVRDPRDGDDTITEKEPKPPKDVTPPKKIDAAFWYWDEVSALVTQMYKTWNKLSAKRNATTAASLGYMVGNVRDMADRLMTWEPKALEDCPKCDGAGVLQDKNKKQTICPNCINGKVGKSTKSKS